MYFQNFSSMYRTSIDIPKLTYYSMIRVDKLKQLKIPNKKLKITNKKLKIPNKKLKITNKKLKVSSSYFTL